MNLKKTLLITKAVSDGNRVRVLMALMHQYELCACHIIKMLGVSAPTVSRHMALLQTAELVSARKDSRWVYYRLADETRKPEMKSFIDWLTNALVDDPVIAEDRKFLEQRPACEAERSCNQRKTNRIKENVL